MVIEPAASQRQGNRGARTPGLRTSPGTFATMPTVSVTWRVCFRVTLNPKLFPSTRRDDRTHEFHARRYGDFVAVANLNLKIEAGEMFGFIGPNGAGKSTTIRFLATLLKATDGEGDRQRPQRHQRPAGRPPQRRLHARQLRRLRRHEGLGVPRLLRRRLPDPRGRRKQVIGDVLELLDLTHKRDDFVNGLSRGMKQRLCLAKTLVHDPPVLILDEPASGLDPRARLEVKALLKELRKMGKTILISSHILTELADCCTSIGIIERGQLLMHGPIDEVYRKITPTATSKSASPATRRPGSVCSVAIRWSQTCRGRSRELLRRNARLGRRRAAADAATGRRRLRAGLVRRKRTDPRRRLHDGDQGSGDVSRTAASRQTAVQRPAESGRRRPLRARPTVCELRPGRRRKVQTGRLNAGELRRGRNSSSAGRRLAMK